MIAAIHASMLTPRDYEPGELDARFKEARARKESATTDADHQAWGRRLYDLDFERRRRQINLWLGRCPPEPCVYPEGLGPDGQYPHWFGGTLY